MTLDEYKKISEEGITDINGSQRKVKLNTSDVGSASSRFGSFLSTIASAFADMVSKFTNDGGFYYTESDFAAEKTRLFTVNSLIFGEYLLFNPKPYEKSTDLNPDITPSGITKAVDFLKDTAVGVGRFLKNISFAIILPMVLVAIVKFLFSTKAADLAAWKKILVRWVLCLLLIYFYQYILIAVDAVADIFIDGLWKTRTNLEEAGYSAFEVTVEEDLSFQLENTGGVTSLAYSVVFVAIVVMQMMFLMKYVFRSIAIIFLFLAAPIIIVMHCIHLMMGKESDTLGEFFKNYVLLVFMQPFHAMFYIIFFFALSEMAINVPVLGIILIYALFRANNIAKAMFGWELGPSIFSAKE